MLKPRPAGGHDFALDDGPGASTVDASGDMYFARYLHASTRRRRTSSRASVVPEGAETGKPTRTGARHRQHGINR
jgi:hypothetical protein